MFIIETFIISSPDNPGVVPLTLALAISSRNRTYQHDYRCDAKPQLYINITLTNLITNLSSCNTLTMEACSPSMPPIAGVLLIRATLRLCGPPNHWYLEDNRGSRLRLLPWIPGRRAKGQGCELLLRLQLQQHQQFRLFSVNIRIKQMSTTRGEL